jgi:hypothetical protein
MAEPSGCDGMLYSTGFRLFNGWRCLRDIDEWTSGAARVLFLAIGPCALGTGAVRAPRSLHRSPDVW